MSQEQAKERNVLAGRTGLAGCAWIISPPGWPYRECGLQPTHRDPKTGETFCSHHADDYADIFGWESLRGLDAESPNTVSQPEMQHSLTHDENGGAE